MPFRRRIETFAHSRKVRRRPLACVWMITGAKQIPAREKCKATVAAALRASAPQVQVQVLDNRALCAQKQPAKVAISLACASSTLRLTRDRTNNKRPNRSPNASLSLKFESPKLDARKGFERARELTVWGLRAICIAREPINARQQTESLSLAGLNKTPIDIWSANCAANAKVQNGHKTAPGPN